MSTKALKAVPPAPRCIPAAPPVNTAVWATGTLCQGLQVRRHHGQTGFARVNPEKCTGCGACEQACPKKVIWIRPESEKPVVMCANHDRGALTRKACTAGCIGCMKCEKSCPEGAIKVTNNVARVDYEKCTGCRTAQLMNVCPVHAITIQRSFDPVGSRLC